ncbi:probable phosphatase 2C 24 [Olea europaea subsp. europaea]|uniref:protein-serine/threonine phosphatase n=1 Tax=Olea europaea subsp. europaea TaxID=158383 RepID=A0A8S0S4F7_OLEEU|nr:probable phosphatase 2C 24 [Olea europaea subsp. europaea]
MAEICYGVEGESKSSTSCEPSSRAARRRRMELRSVKVVPHVQPPEAAEDGVKRPRSVELSRVTFSRDCNNAVENCRLVREEEVILQPENGSTKKNLLTPILSPSVASSSDVWPKFGVASVCGRRRDMEDAVAIQPSFYQSENENSVDFHYFAVYDGHGCSHVATKCRERLHELIREELLLEVKGGSTTWKNVMERSFIRMDKEVIAWNENVVNVSANCRCELQTPECDAVGSTAVVGIVSPDKIVIANCGDSRAVLCRNGKAVPLSSDHKPDRPDELDRIQAAGGRIIYWDGPRVLGVLAMSRAIGDNYLKPYVSCEPEVTITDRSADDDCLILASDGLWDVVSNGTACGVARMCLKGRAAATSETPLENSEGGAGENSDKACSDASMLLTKLALARRSSDNVSVVVIDLRKMS